MLTFGLTSKSLRSTRIFLLFLVLALGVLCFDFSVFLASSFGYVSKARTGDIPLPAATSETEAIVVLTGDQGRIPRALELLRHRKSPILLISGTAKEATLTDLVNQQGDSVVNIHEVWQRIVLESRSSSTQENAIESAKILGPRGVKRLILVTSDFHMWRSHELFQLAFPGVEIVDYPVLSSVGEVSLFPSHACLEGVRRLWSEYWKQFVFRLSRLTHRLPFDNPQRH